MIEKFISNRFTYQGSGAGFKCDVVRLPNKKTASREYLTHAGAVAILPFLDSPTKVPLLKCRIVLVEQFRYPVYQITEELPAGKLEGKEAPHKCLIRELKEETGYTTKKFHHLISYWPTPAFSQEKLHIYWAESLSSGKSKPDEDEFLKVKIDYFGNVLKKVQEGKIRDSKTVIGILAFTVLKIPAGKLG